MRALEHLSSHTVSKLNPRQRKVSRFLDLERFDVVVIHYSVFVISDAYLPPSLRERIARFRGLKVQFIQDEYRWVDEITARIRELGIDVLYTCIPEPAASQVYDSRLPGVTRIQTLPGYVPESVRGRPLAPIRERRLDITYRGQTVPFWLGRFGQEKVQIGQGVRERVARHGLISDIAWTPEERIYGEEWYRFTAASKAALGTESGASIVDFDGSLQRRVDDYLRAHPDAAFDEVHAKILAPYEGNVVIKVVSPRVFEAAALGTALVLFPGAHSGVVQPWDHYIPLEKDFSNFDDVAALVRQPEALQQLADRTYADLVASDAYSLRRFVRDFDRVLDAHAQPSAPGLGWSFAAARADTAVSTAVARATRRSSALKRILHNRLAADAMKLAQVLSSPPLRTLFFRHLRERPIGTAETRQLLADLRKLEIIRRTQLGNVGRRSIRVEASFDADAGTLTIRSRRAEPSEPDTNGDGRVAAALQGGEVRTIVWDCSQAGPIIVGARNQWLGFVPSSIERFPALEQLARAAPKETAAALEASLFPRR